MGWDYCEAWRCKADVLREHTREGRFDVGSRALAVTSVMDGYWAIWQLGTGERFIECGLVRRDGGCYGFKWMDESQGPYYFDVPLAYLDLVPERNPRWRNRVREYHLARKTTGATHARESDPHTSRCRECGSAVYAPPSAAASTRQLILSSADVSHLCRNMIRLREERFRVLAVDVRKQLIRAKTIAVGSLADCAVHPRELFRFLISVSAHGFIAVHNHPSGDPSPSNEDRELTGRLHKAGQLMGIPMIDHVVVARRGTFSFVAGGLL